MMMEGIKIVGRIINNLRENMEVVNRRPCYQLPRVNDWQKLQLHREMHQGSDTSR